MLKYWCFNVGLFEYLLPVNYRQWMVVDARLLEKQTGVPAWKLIHVLVQWQHVFEPPTKYTLVEVYTIFRIFSLFHILCQTALSNGVLKYKFSLKPPDSFENNMNFPLQNRKLLVCLCVNRSLCLFSVWMWTNPAKHKTHTKTNKLTKGIVDQKLLCFRRKNKSCCQTSLLVLTRE